MRHHSRQIRLIPVLLAALALPSALAGCAGANAEFSGSDARAQAASSSSASTAPHASAGKKDWWRDGPMTREKISAMCWMKYEKGRGDLPVETRADLVNQCVAETRKQYAVR